MFRILEIIITFVLQSYVEKIPDGTGWLENTEIVFNKEGTSYMAILPVLDGPHGTYPHICHVDIFTKITLPLTSGSFCVVRIVQWDHDNQLMLVYIFLSHNKNRISNFHLFCIVVKSIGFYIIDF